MHILQLLHKEVQNMHTEDYTASVRLPDTGDFGDRFPQYGPRARDEGDDLFSLVMTPETFVAARVLTTSLGLPAVTAVAEAASQLRGEDISGTDKQYVGALVCSLMEANGFRKRNLKRSIPHPSWSRGEVYEPAESR